MLGGDGPRTYLVVFTSPGHSRAQSGVITNWAEIEIADGQITQTGFGRTADLVGTDPTTSATAWADVTATPDWPTAAANLAPMYASVRRNVDGVLMIDPTGLASLLNVAGPITIEEVGRPFDGPTLLEFLNAGQYELDAATRRTATEAAASAALTQFLSATLPAASEFGHDLGPAVTEGHILGWARRIDEEALFRSVGMSGALPELDGRDGLAVVSNSVNGSEVDTFVSRSITDEVTFDEESGAVTSRVTVTVNNGAPHGVSRTRLLVYSALTAERYEVDGKPVRFATSRDQGWNTAGAVISVPPGAQKTVVVTLHGAVAPHDYALVWRPQPLANPDSVVIHVRSADGDDLLEFTGELPRLSQIDAVGVRPLR
jgi:hypothetical protein